MGSASRPKAPRRDGKPDRKSKERQGESGGVSPPGEPLAGATRSVRSEGRRLTLWGRIGRGALAPPESLS